MTKKITCTLPNASLEISGVPFVAIDGGVMAEGVSDEDAAKFAGIPGYVFEDETETQGGAADSRAAAKAAARAAKIAADQKAAQDTAPAAGSAAETAQEKK